MLHKAKHVFEGFKYSGEEFGIDELVAKIKGKEAGPETLVEYNHLALKGLEARVGLDLAQTTYYKYKRIVRYIDDFLIDTKKVRNIPVSKVNYDFLNQLFIYLQKEKKNDHNSSVALMNCFKTILRLPEKDGTLKKNPFDNFQLTQKPVQRDFLTKDEIVLLQLIMERSLNVDIAPNRAVCFLPYLLKIYSITSSLSFQL